jgi:hypothetical protein
VIPARRSTTAGERVCFRARFLDSNRCDAAPTGEIVWTLQRQSGSANATLDHNCFVATRDSGIGEFDLTATAGALTAHATASVVTADRYRDLIAAHIEDPDAGVVESFSTRPGMGAVVVTTSTPKKSSGWLWALLGLGVVLGAVGLWLFRDKNKHKSKRVRDKKPVESVVAVPVVPSIDQGAEQAGVSVADPPQTQSRPAPIPDARACPKCARRFPSDLGFCPQDGTSLLDAALVTAVSQPESVVESSKPDGVCPKCNRRYPFPTVFCGEDGATLTREKS